VSPKNTGSRMLTQSASASLTRLVTIPEVAARLGVSVRKTWRLVAEGKLKTVRVGVRGTRVIESDLERFIEELAAESRR
jgi:excisionase family DNA binding protein